MHHLSVKPKAKNNFWGILSEPGEPNIFFFVGDYLGIACSAGTRTDIKNIDVYESTL